MHSAAIPCCAFLRDDASRTRFATTDIRKPDMNRARLNEQQRERYGVYATQAEQRRWAMYLIRECTDLRTDQILERYAPRLEIGRRSLAMVKR